MINAIHNQYNALNPNQKNFANGIGYSCAAVFFGLTSLICENASEEAPAMRIFEGITLIVTVESVKSAWRSFQAALN